MGNRKAGLLAAHKRLAVKLLKREVDQRRYRAEELTRLIASDPGRVYWDGSRALPGWQAERRRQEKAAALAEEALRRLGEDSP